MLQQIKRLLLVTSLLVFTAGVGGYAQTTYRSSDGKKVVPAKAAEKKGGFDMDRLIYGGGLYGGGGNRSISLGLSPILGYAITDFWSAGISLGYKYNYVADYFQVFNYDWQKYEYYNLNNHVFVPGVWTRLKVFGNFFTHFEFENVISTYTYHDTDNFGKYYKERTTVGVPCLLLGAGLRQPVTENSSFVIYALYDVFQKMTSNQRVASNGTTYSLSPYANTIDIRIGLNIGF